MIEYSSKQVCRAAGVTPRMLQWWAQMDLVRPLIQGHSARYSETQRTEVCILAELRRRGIRRSGSLAKFRRVLRAVRRRAAGRRFLLTDGTRCDFVATLPEVTGCLAKARQGLCLVDLAEVGALGLVA